MAVNNTCEVFRKRWCTKAEFVKYEFTWEVENLRLRPEFGKESLESPSSTNKSGVIWKLLLYPCYDEEEEPEPVDAEPVDANEKPEEVISLYVKLVDCPVEVRQEGMEVMYCFSILDSTYKQVYTKWSDGYEKFVIGKPEDTNGFSNFVERKKVFDPESNFLSNERLILHCEIWSFKRSLNIDCGINNFQVPDNQVVEDLLKMLDNQQYSDVTLTLRGQEFKCHRNIIAARSVVFARDFEQALTSESPEIVPVHGELEPGAFMKLLRFMYTGEAPSDLEASAGELLKAADEYRVDRLKAMCEQVLCSSLSIDNTVDRLILAQTCSAQQLKSQVIDFICHNFNQISKSAAWADLAESMPKLGYEICSCLHLKNSKD